MRQPLHGARVIDLSRMLTGGYAAMLLGDLGAEVVKVEDPLGGDPLRRMPPHFVGGESAYFLAVSRNKKSVTLDLATPAGQDVLHDLVRRSDVVLDNFRPGVLERLGADWDTIRAINPRIVSCSITAYGHTGPLRDAPAYDLVIQALSGMMSYTGEPGRPPVRMGAPMGDLAGAMFAVSAISAALFARERTGQGRRIDLSLLDCLVSMHTYVASYYWLGGELPQPVGSGHASVVPYRAYRTSDGHIVVAVFVDRFWGLLCDAIGRPELGSDPRYATASARLERREEVDDLLDRCFAERTTESWMEALRASGVPAAPVLTLDRALDHPQIRERGMVVDVDHPSAGKVPMLGNPVRQPGVDETPLEPAPGLGQHTEEILGGLLGYSAERIAALRAAKAI